jgi:hypothetical protein
MKFAQIFVRSSVETRSRRVMRWAFLFCVAFGISLFGWLIQLLIAPKYEAVISVEIFTVREIGLPTILSQDQQVQMLKEAADSAGVEYQMVRALSSVGLQASFNELVRRTQDWFRGENREPNLYRFTVRGVSREWVADSANALARSTSDRVIESVRQNLNDTITQLPKSDWRRSAIGQTCSLPPFHILKKGHDVHRVCCIPWPVDCLKIFICSSVLTVIFVFLSSRKPSACFVETQRQQTRLGIST